jgi:hypothetical protein
MAVIQPPEIVLACNRVCASIDRRIESAQDAQRRYTEQEGFRLLALVGLLGLVGWCVFQ